MEGTPKWPSWPETPSNKFQNTKNSPYRVLGLALRHDCKNTMQITLKRKSMKISGCDNRVKKTNGIGWGSRLSPSPHENIRQVHRVDQTLLPAQVHSFVGCSFHCALHPPCKKERWKKKVRFYIYTDVTHIHNFLTHNPYGTGRALGSRCRGCLCGRCWRHRPALRVAGVALMALPLLACLVPAGAAAVCVCEAWHLEAPWRSVWRASSTSILCGRHGIWWHRPSFCVAGVVHISLGWLWWCAWFPLGPRLFVWQAWRLEASTSIRCGRRGAWRHRPSVRAAGVALMHWAASGGMLGSRWRRGCLCGRRGIWKHQRRSCVAGVGPDSKIALLNVARLSGRCVRTVASVASFTGKKVSRFGA